MVPELKGLEPDRFWRHFHRITRIPRCSGHENEISAYITQMAEKGGLPLRVDAAGNLVVAKPACAGHEDRPVIVLQSHLDMVCEKEPDRMFDFGSDPIELVAEGDWIKANGTTLGADNGVGVALSLAIMVHEDLRTGPLEFLFTVGEEIGLKGAHALTPDMINGRILINLDGEDADTFTIGCAGSRFTAVHLTPAFETIDGDTRNVRLSVGGLKGGHSGLDIHRGRANAIKLLGRLLYAAQQEVGIRLADVKSGTSLNAIPRQAEAQGIIPATELKSLQRIVSALEAVFSAEHHATEPNLRVGLETLSDPGRQRVFTQAFQQNVIHLVLALPNGVFSMDPLVPGLVKTSTNLGAIGIKDGRLTIGTKQRSSQDSEMHAVSDMILACACLAGARVETGGDYPGWMPNPDSFILKRSHDVYTRIFGQKPNVASIHAGLECGLLTGKFGGLDAISMGATIRNAHSPDEALQISSVPKLWAVLTALLENPTG